ncbi:MAG: hypothetical protein ACJ762_07245 [Solirubrobacteraceae bacterium]
MGAHRLALAADVPADMADGASLFAIPEDPAASALCQTAIALVGERGVAAVTDDALVARSGGDRRTLDRHFGSAEHCVAASYQAVADITGARWEQAVARHEGFAESLAVATADGLVWLSAFPSAGRLLIGDRRAGGPTLVNLRLQTRRRTVGQLERHYRERIGGPVSTLQLELLAGAIGQVCTDWLDDGLRADAASLRDRLEAVVRCFDPVCA